MWSSPSQAPSRLGRYDLLRRLAVGGMGEIFLARERGVAGVDRLVVVKLLLAELAEERAHVALFIDEARIAMQLAHPNIVQVYEFGEQDGVYFLAMEYVPGQNLARVCERAARNNVPYPRHSAVHVVAQIARGLHYAHEATDSHGNSMGIVHRDISPHNALISIRGDIKLLDFGIAQASIRRQRTQTGVLRGKFGYMSPEQVEQAELDPRSDVFCAGIVLWETTLMRRLFRGASELETIKLVASCRVPAPRSIDPSYPEDLEAVVLTALAKHPDERFQSAGAMAAALRNTLKRQPQVEQEKLGKLVTTLFPETMPDDLKEVARITAPFKAEAPPVDVQHSRETRNISGGAAGRSEESANAALPPSAPADSDPTPHRRTWLWLGVAALVITVASAALLLRGGSSASASADLADASPGDASIDALNAAPTDAAATATAATLASPDAAQPIARAKRPRPRPDRRRPTPPKRTPADAGVTSPRRLVTKLDAAPAPRSAPPATGRLAVAAKPWGRVTINGRNVGHTNLVERLAPGTYRIVIRMSDGSGTYAASATIVSNKKTKCQVLNKSLRCQSPR